MKFKLGLSTVPDGVQITVTGPDGAPATFKAGKAAVRHVLPYLMLDPAAQDKANPAAAAALKALAGHCAN